MNKKMRTFTVIGLLSALICVATSCAPQPGANANKPASNANASASKSTAAGCEIATVRDNILAAINNPPISREQYVNATIRANVIYLYGYTAADTKQHQETIDAANQLIAMAGCSGEVELDTTNFFNGPPDAKNPMLRLPGNVCAAGYKKCGAICIPDTEDCFIRSPSAGNVNMVPTRTPTPSPTASPKA